MQARVAESGNGKLDHQFFFRIHFDLRDCTVSIRCYLGHLQRKQSTVRVCKVTKIHIFTEKTRLVHV